MNKKFSNTLDNLIIVKRSGQRVNFNGNKIAIAIKQAFDNVFEDTDETQVNQIYENVLKNINDNYKGRKTINVEDIQDIIEQELITNKYLNVYECFNSYRQKRTALRKVFEEKQDHKFAKAVEKLSTLTKNNEQSFSSNIINKFGETISTEYAKAYVLENKFIKLLEEGIIEINNLDEYITSKTVGSHLDFSNLSANNMEEYIDKMIRIIYKCKLEQYGEHTISSFDYIFVNIVINEFKNILKVNLKKHFKLYGILNFIKFDLIEEDIEKIQTIYIEKLYFARFFENKIIENIFEIALEDSLNELKDITYNNLKKLVFSLEENFLKSDFKISISFGTNILSEEAISIRVWFLKVIAEVKKLNNLNIIYKVNKMNEEEIKLILDLIKAGKSIYILFEKQDENYKNELEVFSTGERIYENIITENKNSLGRILLSTTSINLARLGLEFKNKSISEFYDKLSDVLEIVKNQLVQRFELQGSRYKEDYKYLFENNTIYESNKLESNQKIRKTIRNGALNISLVGLYECTLLLSNEKNDNKAYEILRFIQSKVDEFISEEKLNFIISETYNENVLERLISIDKSIYGIIPILDKNKYDNFCKIYEKLNLEEKLKKEGKYQNSISSVIEINISKRDTINDFIKLIKLLQKSNIIFCKMETISEK